MKKRKPWYEKHREANDQLRAMSGAQMGDGLKLLDKMKHGSEVQRELYKLYCNMSADQADALISHYAQNPLLRMLFEGKPVEFSQKIPEENLEKKS